MNILANTYRLNNLKWNSRLVNEHKGNLVEIADFISVLQNLLRSKTHALNGFATAYTANTKIEQTTNVHECS